MKQQLQCQQLLICSLLRRAQSTTGQLEAREFNIYLSVNLDAATVFVRAAQQPYSLAIAVGVCNSTCK